MEVPHSSATYSALHTSEGDDNPMEHEGGAEGAEYNEEEEYDEMDYTYSHHHSKKHEEKKPMYESFDFNDSESLMWRKVGFYLFSLFLFLF
jgi:hypothetical protein